MRNVYSKLGAVLAAVLLAASPAAPVLAMQPAAGSPQQTPKDCKKHPDQRGCKGTQY
jgi:hypothetical protein